MTVRRHRRRLVPAELDTDMDTTKPPDLPAFLGFAITPLQVHGPPQAKTTTAAPANLEAAPLGWIWIQRVRFDVRQHWAKWFRRLWIVCQPGPRSPWQHATL